MIKNMILTLFLYTSCFAAIGGMQEPQVEIAIDDAAYFKNADNSAENLAREIRDKSLVDLFKQGLMHSVVPSAVLKVEPAVIKAEFYMDRVTSPDELIGLLTLYLRARTAGHSVKFATVIIQTLLKDKIFIPENEPFSETDVINWVLKHHEFKLMKYPIWRKAEDIENLFYLTDDRLAWIYRKNNGKYEFVEKVDAMEMDPEIGPQIQQIKQEVDDSFKRSPFRVEAGYLTGIFWPEVRKRIYAKLGVDWISPDEINYSSLY